MIIVVLVLIGVAVFAWIRWSNRQHSHVSDAPPPAIFKVLSLGLSGSGKTVFLACMFYEMYVANHERRSFHIETSAENAKILSGIRESVVDSDREWPSGTGLGDTKEFLFDVVVKDRDRKDTVLQFSYLDYPGELFEHTSHADPLVEETKNEQLEELERQSQHAHAIFAVIDGRKMVQYLRGERAGQIYMQATISPMLAMVGSSTCPVHFLLTKWDLVRDVGEDIPGDPNSCLARVRSALHEHPAIGAMIRSGVPGGRRVRLIPVSAVGPNFAELTDEGEVVKVAGAVAEPTNLDIPLSAIVPDYFSQLERDLTASDKATIRKSAVSRGGTPTRQAVELTLKALSVATRTTINSALRLSVGSVAAEAVAELFFDYVAKGTGRAEKADDTDDADSEEARRQELRAQVLEEFTKAIWLFENDLPASKLGHG